MENANFIEKIATNLEQSASVRNVFGEPVVAGGKTIIPVATLSYGFGGGFGRGLRKGGKKNSPSEVPPDASNSDGTGAGGGGGLRATPCGVYEITPAETRFLPANPYRTFLLGIVAGLALKLLLFPHRRN